MKAPFRRTDYYRHQRWMGMIWMFSIPMIWYGTGKLLRLLLL